ncbi:MaoC family dehydratase N-terminal domain-containing protein [Roseicyclus sp. F158]|uniref:MaoC family dehydratase N-terminal domain-containing protein n=1 Tax=Tropicimonas omnivorans TaxID=3075590 RepID=A0ABU3DHM8_9RHOB|nr:MaoC family dehydratase N-terminal domain-containing protein [Roseicyclus sp. F158]MDT0683039.1 MaoC family dehydratase N-terminal domain-containing protein [Roseicyclus sp. F158]
MTTQTALREDDHRSAIGRVETRSERMGPARVAAMAAVLDLDDAPVEGGALPPGWHWLFFNPAVRRSELGSDGHPRRGGFLPDVALPRRMWAGGRLRYHAPVPVGAQAEKTSEILDVVSKSGRAGNLVFVTVRHSIAVGGALCIEEEQDIVYREAPAPDAPKPSPSAAPANADRSVEVVPDPVLLFRYSALTWNGHRIHYDHPYATGEEGYPDLVVHGPLIATLLQGFAAESRPDERLVEFTFRGMAPLFVGQSFKLESAPGQDGKLDLWARGPDGELAMKAEAAFGTGVAP